MSRSRRSVAVCLGALCLGMLAVVVPGRSQGNLQGEIAVGAAALKRSNDYLTGQVQKLPDRFAQQVQDVAVQELAQYGARVMGEYDTLGAPIEVVVCQSMLLVADRIANENNPELTGMVALRLQQMFGKGPDELEKYHAQKLAWSEVVLGLSIAKATGKNMDDLVAQVKAGKAWPEVAQGAGLQKGKLGEIMKQLWQQGAGQ